MTSHKFEDIQKLLSVKEIGGKLIDFTNLTLHESDKEEFHIIPEITQCIVYSKLGMPRGRREEYRHVEDVLYSVMSEEDVYEHETYDESDELREQYEEYVQVEWDIHKLFNETRPKLMREIRYKHIKKCANVIGEAWLRAKWSPRTKWGRKLINDLYDDNELE